MHLFPDLKNMVNLVIVSHSLNLAKSVAEYSLSFVGNRGNFKVAYCGGSVTEPGADPVKIAEAIRAVYTPDGVLVLMDAGSSVSNTKRAISILERDIFPNILLCPAPLMEGATCAACASACGSSLDDVYKEATSCLEYKYKELDDAMETGIETIGSGVSFPFSDLFRFIVTSANGLHARPAAELVVALSKFKSEVLIRNITKNSLAVNAKSLNNVALSNIENGDEAELIISGEDSKRLVRYIKRHFKHQFKPLDEFGNPYGIRGQGQKNLKVLSPGIAVGTVYVADSPWKTFAPLAAQNIFEEIKRLNRAISNVKTNLLQSKKKLESLGLKDEVSIFDAHVMLLEDQELLDEIRGVILSKSVNAEYAYQLKTLDLYERFKNLDNEYMRERAVDILDISSQVIAELQGRDNDNKLLKDVILIAEEVTPSMLNRWEPSQLKGFLTYKGSGSSHVAILAKALGVPAMAGYSPDTDIKSGTLCVFDTFKKEIHLKPTQRVYNSILRRYNRWQQQLAMDVKDGAGLAVTQDNIKIDVFANIGDENTAKLTSRLGADGVGLLRTEFLFMNVAKEPTERDQVVYLKSLFSHYSNKDITVRTLDAGGDKPVSWLGASKEKNPFLGLRGVRLYKQNESFFLRHLKAILRAGDGHNLHVMFPMVSTSDEVVFCKGMLDKARYELQRDGHSHVWPVKTGIMIETPASVLTASDLAPLVDFFSIGTNDLTQYIMSAERGGRFNDLLDFMQPSVIRALSHVIKGAKSAGISVSVCGEMAGVRHGAALLIGLGATRLSMSGRSIGVIKRFIRESKYQDLAKLSADVLDLPNLSTVKEIMAEKGYM